MSSFPWLIESDLTVSTGVWRYMCIYLFTPLHVFMVSCMCVVSSSNWYFPVTQWVFKGYTWYFCDLLRTMDKRCMGCNHMITLSFFYFFFFDFAFFKYSFNQIIEGKKNKVFGSSAHSNVKKSSPWINYKLTGSKTVRSAPYCCRSVALSQE